MTNNTENKKPRVIDVEFCNKYVEYLKTSVFKDNYFVSAYDSTLVKEITKDGVKALDFLGSIQKLTHQYSERYTDNRDVHIKLTKCHNKLINLVRIAYNGCCKISVTNVEEIRKLNVLQRLYLKWQLYRTSIHLGRAGKHFYTYIEFLKTLKQG